MIKLDDEVVDWLLPELVGSPNSAGKNSSPASFIVYLFLWRIARSWVATVSYTEIANGTGFSRSSAQATIGLLNERGFVRTTKEKATSKQEHHLLRPWATSRRRTSTPPRTSAARKRSK